MRMKLRNERLALDQELHNALNIDKDELINEIDGAGQGLEAMNSFNKQTGRSNANESTGRKHARQRQKSVESVYKL